MRRRDFLALAGATATAWPLAAVAQSAPARGPCLTIPPSVLFRADVLIE